MTKKLHREEQNGRFIHHDFVRGFRPAAPVPVVPGPIPAPLVATPFVFREDAPKPVVRDTAPKR